MLVFKVLFYILHLCLWVSLGGDKLIVGLFAVVILALRVPLSSEEKPLHQMSFHRRQNELILGRRYCC